MTEVTLNPSEGAVRPVGTPASVEADAAAKAAAALERGAEAVEAKPVEPTGGTPAPKAEPKPEPTADEKRFAQLARKERELVERQRSMRAQSERLRQEATLVQRAREFERLAKTNPVEALKLYNVDYDDVTQSVLNEGKPGADLQVKALREELQRFQARQRQEAERSRAAQAMAIRREQQAAVSEFNEEVAEYVKTNADTYELTNLHNGYGMVSQVIEQYFRQTGKVMSPKEAADQVESYLESAVQKSIETKKWKQRANQAPSKDVKTSPGQQPSSTLTNDLTASTASVTNTPLTERERIKRAIAKLA